MEPASIRLRPFKMKDTAALMNWGRHDDPRFFHYNFPYTSQEELVAWYRVKKKFLRRWIYAIDLNGRVVGYITLKNVKWSKKRGEMGIALDPNYTGRGIGTRAICLYLNRVFRDFRIDEIYLKTALFNKRAVVCYENIGFVLKQTRNEVFEEQAFRSEILNRFPFFDCKGKTLYTDYLYMEIGKEDFKGRYLAKSE